MKRICDICLKIIEMDFGDNNYNYARRFVVHTKHENSIGTPNENIISFFVNVINSKTNRPVDLCETCWKNSLKQMANSFETEEEES